MSKLFNDTNRNNITLKEWAAVRCILESERGWILAKELITTMSEMDEDAPLYFFGLIPGISQIQTARLNAHIRRMRGNISELGRHLSADKVKNGQRKGTPQFLTQKFVGDVDLWLWHVLEYIQEFANFQEYAHEVELGVRTEIPKATCVCQLDELRLAYVLRFCKFLDDLETKNIKELVSEHLFDDNPEIKDMIDWCKEHRSEWDDVSNKYKPRSVSPHESLAEDLCDNAIGLDHSHEK